MKCVDLFSDTVKPMKIRSCFWRPPHQSLPQFYRNLYTPIVTTNRNLTPWTFYLLLKWSDSSQKDYFLWNCDPLFKKSYRKFIVKFCQLLWNKYDSRYLRCYASKEVLQKILVKFINIQQTFNNIHICITPLLQISKVVVSFIDQIHNVYQVSPVYQTVLQELWHFS